MLAIKALSGARTMLPHIKNSCRPSFFLQNSRIIQCCSSYDNQKRLFHITQEKRDIESGFRAIGAGVAITGVIGPGIGIGYVFGTYCSAVARNPSLAGQLFNAAIMGAAFCEALGLFAMMISFLAFLM